MSPPLDSFFGSIPFNIVITTFVVLIVSFVLVMEEEAMVQKEEQEKLQRFAVLLLLTAQATGGAARRRSRDADETSTNPEEEQPKKRRYIFYDRARTRDSILQDNIGPNPIFDAREFRRMFRISRNVHEKIKNKVILHEFFSVGEYDCFGRLYICKDAKLMIALKHLAYGVSTNSWCNYFQMAELTGRKCVEVLCHCIYKSKRLCLEFLRHYNLEDAKRVDAMHLQVHGIPGMLGLLDCMHVQWKNCPITGQGVYMGKEKLSTIVLEAVADANLWFWHAVFGFAGSCNDINILDVSPLHTSFVDGSHVAYDFEFEIDDRVFNKPYYLVDGIYPKLSRFISVPVNYHESRFAGKQEAARKDVERAFGVWKSKWRLLSSPIEKWDKVRIQEKVVSCIIMHNMMEQELMDGSDDPSIAEAYFTIDDDNVHQANVPRTYDVAEERVGAIEAEIARASGNPHAQFHEDRIRLLSFMQHVVHERWTMLYNEKEHLRLQNALINKVNKKTY